MYTHAHTHMPWPCLIQILTQCGVVLGHFFCYKASWIILISNKIENHWLNFFLVLFWHHVCALMCFLEIAQQYLRQINSSSIMVMIFISTKTDHEHLCICSLPVCVSPWRNAHLYPLPMSHLLNVMQQLLLLLLLLLDSIIDLQCCVSLKCS